MNGRIYDPTLGRFLQADPHIQAPKNSQSYNRYSYVLNNPLSYTDPSGYLWNPLKSLGRSLIRGAVKIFGADAVAIAGNIASMFCGPAAAACAAGWNYEFTRAMGGSTSQALRGAFTAAASVYAFQQIGGHFKGVSGGAGANINFGGNLLTAGQVAQQIAAHAVVGGISSTLQGGKFGHGFFAAGVTKGLGGALLAGGTDVGSTPELIQNTVISAVIGGTASVISGGKFSNGARTAAMQYLFNQANEALQEGGYANPLGQNFDGAVKVKVGGKWMYVPRDMVADIKLAEATNTSVGEYTRTTPEEYAKGIGYVGGTLATIGSGGVAYFGWAALGGAAWLDPSPQNLIGALVGPFSKMMGPLDEVFYPGSQTLEQTINTIGHINDGITVACDIPLRCN
jgi:hypothetical protein